MSTRAMEQFYDCANRLSFLSEKWLLGYLCWKAEEDTFIVAESQAKVAERLGVTQPSVARNMGILERAGWVTVLERKAGPTPNVVRVNVSPSTRPR